MKCWKIVFFCFFAKGYQVSKAGCSSWWWGPTISFTMMLNRLKVDCFSLYISHFVVVHMIGRFLFSIWLSLKSYTLSFTLPSFIEYMTLKSYTLSFTLPAFHFVVPRKVAVTLKLNNVLSIAQIPIKLYIFEKLHVLGIYLSWNFS